MPCYQRRAPLRMPCYKRRAPGSVRIASMGNARATLSRGGVQANDPRIHMHIICIYVFESASVIWSQTVREQRDCEDRRAHLSFSSLFAFMCTIQQVDQKCPPQALEILFFFLLLRRGKGRRKRHAAMAEGTDGRDSAGRE